MFPLRLLAFLFQKAFPLHFTSKEKVFAQMDREGEGWAFLYRIPGGSGLRRLQDYVRQAASQALNIEWLSSFHLTCHSVGAVYAK